MEAIAFVHRCPDQGLVWCRPASGLVLRNAAPGLAAIHRRAFLFGLVTVNGTMAE